MFIAASCFFFFLYVYGVFVSLFIAVAMAK